MPQELECPTRYSLLVFAIWKGVGSKQNTIKAVLCWKRAAGAGHAGAAIALASGTVPVSPEALSRPASDIFEL